MIKRIYIYIAITIIFLFVLSSIKQHSKEAFANIIPWYKSDYFIIPILGTLLLTGPILFLVYKYVLQPVNKSLTEVT